MQPMKNWKCKHCNFKKITDDNIIICICDACLEEMQRENSK